MKSIKLGVAENKALVTNESTITIRLRPEEVGGILSNEL